MRKWMVAVLCVLLPVTATGQTGGIVTLYALDPVGSTFSFRTGVYGHVVSNGVATNRESDIDFGQYGVDQFSVGVEGARLEPSLIWGAPLSFRAATAIQRLSGCLRGSLRFVWLVAE